MNNYYTTDSTSAAPWAWATTIKAEPAVSSKMERLGEREAERWALRRGRLLALETALAMRGDSA